MRLLKLRLFSVASLAILTGMVVAADSSLSTNLTKKALEADIAHLNKLADLAKTRRVGGRVKSNAVLVAMHAENLMSGADAAKMATIRDQALKIAEKYKTPAEVSKEISGLASVSADPKATPKPMGAEKLIKETKLELYEAMDLFGGSNGGGMNLEKDIQSIKRNGVKDAAELPNVELIGVRTAALADLTMHLPNDKVMNGGASAKKTWDGYSADMKKFSIDLATEAAKGGQADLAAIKTAASKLDASCLNCHNKYRAD